MPHAHSNKGLVLITGATGNTGFSALKEFKKCGLRVRAGCYERSDKVKLVESLNPESVVIYDADRCDDALDKAFQGVEMAFIIPSRSPNRVKHIRNFVDLAKKHQLKYLVLFSFLAPPESQHGYVKEYLEMENIVFNSGIPYSIIKSGILFQFLFLFQPDISKGALPLPWGNGVLTPVSSQDVAELACFAICQYPQYDRTSFYLTGSEQVDGYKLAEIASNALGREIKYFNVTRDTTYELLKKSDLSDEIANEFLQMFDDVATGKFARFHHNILPRLFNKEATKLYEFFDSQKERFNDQPHLHPIKDAPEGYFEKEKGAVGEVKAAAAEKQPSISVVKPITGAKEEEEGVGAKRRLTEDELDKLGKTRDAVLKVTFEQSQTIDQLEKLIVEEKNRREKLKEVLECMDCTLKCLRK